MYFSASDGFLLPAPHRAVAAEGPDLIPRPHPGSSGCPAPGCPCTLAPGGHLTLPVAWEIL